MVIYIQVLLVELSATPPDEDLLTTAGLYFMTLEVGLALATMCLPTIYGLFAKKGVRTMARSWASALSLSNLSRSRGSGQGSSCEPQSNDHKPGPSFDRSRYENGSTKIPASKPSSERSGDVEMGHEEHLL